MTVDLAPERSNFFYSFTLLPKQKREAMHRIYDFCRYTDDLADESTAPLETKRARLDAWRQEVEACYAGQARHPILRALHKVLIHFEIPKELLLSLIEGVEMDLVKTRYETFEELREYCYRVASVVGLISIRVFGSTSERAERYAENLGYALQLTNILRDVKHDGARGRIYLPMEDIRAFGYAEHALIASEYNEQFVALMRFEAERAKEFYAIARSELPAGERRRLFAAQIMDVTYYRLLEKIEHVRYDVFARRIRLSTPRKLCIALRIWATSYRPAP